MSRTIGSRISRSVWLVALSLLASLGGCPGLVEEQPIAKDTALAGFTISPSAGPLDGGTIVTIVGSGFGPDTSVQFGGQAADLVTIVNEQLITAVVPPVDAPGVVDVTLHIPVAGGSQPRASDKGFLVLKADFTYYDLPPDDGRDADGDGLSDYQELSGWDVWIDAFGLGLGEDTFGNVTRYTCISNPSRKDTDGDGLPDREEFLARCDAAKADTDGDDLTDLEEVVRFHTSPTSIDSDGDARGPEGSQPPNVALFDGAELLTAGFTEPEQLFLSEYVEGSNNNRALEIYNPTSERIDLAAGGYSIVVRDGVPDYYVTTTIPLSGSVSARSTFVVADPLASRAIRRRANQLAPLPFDGVQLVELQQNGDRIDTIGSETVTLGPPARDQEQTQSGAWHDVLGSNSAEQTFTVGASGRMERVEVKLRTDQLFGQTCLLVVFRGSTALDAALVTIPGSTGPDGVTLAVEMDPPFIVHANESLRLWMSPFLSVGSFGVAYALGNPYPGGAAVFNPDADYYFTTTVAPIQPWGAEGHSTRDQLLRRKFGICTPVAIVAEAFDPALGWDAFPATMVNGLGWHESSCVPYRIVAGGTSPSIADTDGDGATDAEEFDHPFRSPLLADLPAVSIDVADAIDVRLLVEYSDSEGTSTEYSTSFSEGTSTTTGTAHSSSISDSIAVSIEGEVQFGTDAHKRIQFGFEYGHEWGQEWTASAESTQESQREYASAVAASQERSESVSRGEMATGIVVRNTGPVAYEIGNMAIAVRQYIADLERRGPDAGRTVKLRTIGTLLPVVESVTLASGEASPVLRFADEDVNPDFVREYLRDPTGLILEPVAFDLTNEEGLNYAFITQVTQSRTALVAIDYTDPDQPYERYYVATNVDRGTDGSFTGVPLRTVLEKIIGLPRRQPGDGNLDDGYVVEPLGPEGQLALTRVRGLGPDTIPGSTWFVIGNAQGVYEDLDTDGHNDLGFDDIVLRAGDAIRLVLARDDDADGLVNLEEIYHGTKDQPGEQDSDRDGLTDKQELDGWPVTIAGQTRWVVSNPRVSDSDQDGLTDPQEYALGADPSNADTDGDSLADAIDAYPLIPAGKLYVNAAAPAGGDGSSWASAYRTIEAAVATAESRNSNGQAEDDVSAVWVAKGVYRPQSGLAIRSQFGLFGGFSGAETRLGERNADPFTNETVISGNIGNPNDPTDNLTLLVFFDLGTTSGTALDGFTLSDAHGGEFGGGKAISMRGNNVTLRNLLILNNTGTASTGDPTGVNSTGAGISVSSNRTLTLTNVSFVQNSAPRATGMYIFDGAQVTLNRCRFIGNRATSNNPVTAGGAGMFVASGGAVVRLYDCLFEGNHTSRYQDAGGLYVSGGSRVELDRCSFRSNNTELQSVQGVHKMQGGGIYNAGTVVARNCTFYGNGAIGDPDELADAEGGGGIFSTWNSHLYLYNCSFSQNVCGTAGIPGACCFDGAAVVARTDNSGIYNCVFVDNYSWQTDQLRRDRMSDSLVTQASQVRHCLFTSGADDPARRAYQGRGNTFVLPSVPVLLPGPTLKLVQSSPAIDAGLNFFDADPIAPGIQFMDEFDIGGKPRVVDGDGDGEAIIDVGAHEAKAAGL